MRWQGPTTERDDWGTFCTPQSPQADEGPPYPTSEEDATRRAKAPGGRGCLVNNPG